jgi:hypothetical protein
MIHLKVWLYTVYKLFSLSEFTEIVQHNISNSLSQIDRESFNIIKTTIPVNLLHFWVSIKNVKILGGCLNI